MIFIKFDCSNVQIMATIKFLLQSKSNTAPIYLRLSISRGNTFYRKTGLYINPKDWGDKGLPKNQNTSSDNEELTTVLKDLESKILKNFNEDNSKGIIFNGDWLQNKIDIHFKRISETKQNEEVSYWIDKIVKEAHTKENGKGEVGLSQCRILAYNRLLHIFNKFQGKRNYKISELDNRVFEDFKKWLLDKQKFSSTYSLKKLSDLKAVCKEVRASGIEAGAGAAATTKKN